MKRGNGSGLVPAICSVVLPGLGQLINGETSKALGVFLVWAVCSASLIRWIPLLGTLAALVAGATWIYAVADAFVTARKP